MNASSLACVLYVYVYKSSLEEFKSAYLPDVRLFLRSLRFLANTLIQACDYATISLLFSLLFLFFLCEFFCFNFCNVWDLCERYVIAVSNYNKKKIGRRQKKPSILLDYPIQINRIIYTHSKWKWNMKQPMLCIKHQHSWLRIPSLNSEITWISYKPFFFYRILRQHNICIWNCSRAESALVV